MAVYAPQPAPPRRRARWPWVLLSIVVVLAVLFVVADRVALHFAEDKAASTLQSSQHLSTKPDVSVGGFPFLTQLLAGEFDDVTISADNISVGNNAMTLKSVVVHLQHVTVPRDYSSVRARTAQADAQAGYDQLSQALHVQVSNGGHGRLVAKPTVHIAGQTFTGTVSAVPQASSQRGITFTNPKLKVSGVQLPSVAAHALVSVFSRAISLAGLPFHITVTGVSVTDTGLVLHLSGRNLVYQR
jgi:hypothetical protein